MNTQRWMSSQIFSFFMTWGIFLPYWTGWIIYTKGITVSQASLIMSLGLVARGLSTLVAFPFFSEKFSSQTLLNIMASGTLISLLSYIPATSFIGLLLATLLLHFFYSALMPALDSATLNARSVDSNLHNHVLKKFGLWAAGMAKENSYSIQDKLKTYCAKYTIEKLNVRPIIVSEH